MGSPGFGSLKDIMKTPAISSSSSQNSKIFSTSLPPSPPPPPPPPAPLPEETNQTIDTELPRSLKSFIISGSRILPPPITCLRNLKKGKLHTYYRYCEIKKAYVIETYRIPKQNLCKVYRQDGRLTLFLAPDDDDDESSDEDEPPIPVVSEPQMPSTV